MKYSSPSDSSVWSHVRSFRHTKTTSSNDSQTRSVLWCLWLLGQCFSSGSTEVFTEKLGECCCSVCCGMSLTQILIDTAYTSDGLWLLIFTLLLLLLDPPNQSICFICLNVSMPNPIFIEAIRKCFLHGFLGKELSSFGWACKLCLVENKWYSNWYLQ